ncbi:MAG: TolC family protein [Betaproteobacteria bacterium]|nr:TolC family protein [Betaproteobacteria bacterium]
MRSSPGVRSTIRWCAASWQLRKNNSLTSNQAGFSGKTSPLISAACDMRDEARAPVFANQAAATDATAPVGIAAASAPDAASAQPAFDIDTLTARVLAANADLKAAAAALDAARAGITSASAMPNPRLEWHLGPSRGVGGARSGAAASVTVAQPVENPRLREARIAAAEAGLEQTRAQRRALRNDLAAQVRALALEMRLREEEARAHADALQLLMQVRERTLRRVEIGEAPRYDLIKADAEIISARQRLEQSRLMTDRVRLAINRLAGGTLPSSWTLAGLPGREMSVPPHTDGAEGRIESSPELQVLQHTVRRSAEKLQQMRASVVPSVDVLLGHGRDPDMRQTTVGMSVTLPLRDRRAGPIAEAQADLIRAQTVLDGRRSELAQEWRMALKSLEMAQARVRSLDQGALREAEAAVRVAEAAWRFGERGILDVLDAQRVLRALRADLIQARFEAQAALIEIERLEGRYADL